MEYVTIKKVVGGLRVDRAPNMKLAIDHTGMDGGVIYDHGYSSFIVEWEATGFRSSHAYDDKEVIIAENSPSFPEPHNSIITIGSYIKILDTQGCPDLTEGEEYKIIGKDGKQFLELEVGDNIVKWSCMGNRRGKYFELLAKKDETNIPKPDALTEEGDVIFGGTLLKGVYNNSSNNLYMKYNEVLDGTSPFDIAKKLTTQTYTANKPSALSEEQKMQWAHMIWGPAALEKFKKKQNEDEELPI